MIHLPLIALFAAISAVPAGHPGGNLPTAYSCPVGQMRSIHNQRQRRELRARLGPKRAAKVVNRSAA
jgi:hypothetical protein